MAYVLSIAIVISTSAKRGRALIKTLFAVLLLRSLLHAFLKKSCRRTSSVEPLKQVANHLIVIHNHYYEVVGLGGVGL